MKSRILLACFLSSGAAVAQYPEGSIMADVTGSGTVTPNPSWDRQVETTRQRIDSIHKEMGYGEHRREADLNYQQRLMLESNRATNRALVDGIRYDRALAIEQAIQGLRGGQR